MKTTKSLEWVLLKNVWISKKPVLPGVWRRKEGGHLVRARAKEGTTGKLKDIFRVMPEADASTALQWLVSEKARIRERVVSAILPRPRFSEFAASLFEHKLKVGDIKSAAGRKRWGYVLTHLIEGVVGKSGAKVRGFGEMFLDRITTTQIEQWKEEVAVLITAGDYVPPTANGWFAILRVVMKAAKRQHALPTLATEGIGGFDESEHKT